MGGIIVQTVLKLRSHFLQGGALRRDVLGKGLLESWIRPGLQRTLGTQRQGVYESEGHGANSSHST